jgi:hypothetical protein
VAEVKPAEQPKAGAVAALRAKGEDVKAARPAPDARPESKAVSVTGRADEAKKEVSCTLQSLEAPRGGQLVLRGRGFGSTPVVRIAGQVARIIKRGETEITIQVSQLSDGGAVSLHAGGKKVDCGVLKIIGKDR